MKSDGACAFHHTSPPRTTLRAVSTLPMKGRENDQCPTALQSLR